MDLNELIHARLAGCKEISDKLAKYDGQPAIFNTEFPSDQQPGWGGVPQYPRICFRVDMQVSQERSAAGSLHVTVYANKNPLELDALEGMVKRCLEDVLMKPHDQAPFCVAWARTEPYLIEGLAVIYKDIMFDILEYPGQETTDPDPILAVSSYIKNLYPDSVVLGIDRIGEFTIPAERPVFFCRLEDIRSTDGHCMHSISWFNARIAVHLLYPNALTRLKMISGIYQRMGIDEEIIMLDQSPMELNEIAMNNKADYLREGQLTVTGKYGVLRRSEKKKNIIGVRLDSN